MKVRHLAETPQAQVTLPKLHHHAEKLVHRRRSKSRRRVSAYRCRSVTPIIQHLLPKEHLRVQSTVTSNNQAGSSDENQAGSSELVGHRPNPNQLMAMRICL